jgi:hypothetical protein
MSEYKTMADEFKAIKSDKQKDKYLLDNNLIYIQFYFKLYNSDILMLDSFIKSVTTESDFLNEAFKLLSKVKLDDLSHFSFFILHGETPRCLRNYSCIVYFNINVNKDADTARCYKIKSEFINNLSNKRTRVTTRSQAKKKIKA